MHELDVPVLDVIVSGLLFHDLVLGRRPHRPLTERVAGQGEGGRQRRVRRRRLGPTEQWDPAVLDHLEHCDVFLPNTDEAMLYRLPQLRPIVLFTVVMSTIGGLQTFAEPRVMVGNGGGTGQSGMTVVLFFYRAGFLANDYGYAAAIALGIGARVVVHGNQLADLPRTG